MPRPSTIEIKTDRWAKSSKAAYSRETMLRIGSITHLLVNRAEYDATTQRRR